MFLKRRKIFVVFVDNCFSNVHTFCFWGIVCIFGALKFCVERPSWWKFWVSKNCGKLMRLFFMQTLVATTLLFSNTFFLSSKSPFFIRITRLIVYFILLHQSPSCRRLFGDLNQFNVFLLICLKFVLIYPMVFLLLHTHLVQWLLWLNLAVLCWTHIYVLAQFLV